MATPGMGSGGQRGNQGGGNPGGGDHGNDHTVTISVNTDPHQVNRGRLTFVQLVTLAYPNLVGNPELMFKISYRLGRGHSELKTLAEGDTVEAQEGMIFNVSYENRS
jgi:Multiubiquitin